MLESVALPAAQRDPRLHSGGLAVPMVQDRPRLNKPPLIYWLQSASAATFTLADPRRDAIWMYRVPSLLAAIASVLLTWRLGARLFNESIGHLAALALAVAPVIAWEAHQSRADMLLLACTLAAMRALFEVFRGKNPLSSAQPTPATRWLWPIAFWLACAAGFLTKGPIILMIAALAIATLSVLSRRARWILALRPLLGLVILTASVAPWLYAVASHVGFDRYLSIVRDELLGRSLEPKEGHWGPPGYHIALLSFIFWPGVMLAGVAIPAALRIAFPPGAPIGSTRFARVRALLIGARLADPALAFALAWLIPSWIVFELVSTKLPHYTMPLLPAVAILAAWGARRADAGDLPQTRTRLVRLGLLGWLCIALTFIIATLALAIVSAIDQPLAARRIPALAISILGPLVSLALFVSSARALRAHRYARAHTAGILLMLPLLIALFQFLLPRPLGLSDRLANHLAALDPSSSRPLAMLIYHEDSMVFHTRGRIERIDPPAARDWLIAHPTGLLLAPPTLIANLQREPGTPRLEQRALESGLQYSRGKRVELAWFERAP